MQQSFFILITVRSLNKSNALMFYITKAAFFQWFCEFPLQLKLLNYLHYWNCDFLLEGTTAVTEGAHSQQLVYTHKPAPLRAAGFC